MRFCGRLAAAAMCGVLAWPAAAADAGANGADAALAPRVLHYAVQCHPGERCKIECFQAGRIIVSRAQIQPEDRITLVLTDGFSDRLQPLWLEIRAGPERRTVLLPRDALCDLQGFTINAFPG